MSDSASTAVTESASSNPTLKEVLAAKPSGPDFIPYANDLLMRYTVEYGKARARSKSGRAPIRSAGLIPARNRECPCGSGKKYKSCCRVRVPYVMPKTEEPEDVKA